MKALAAAGLAKADQAGVGRRTAERRNGPNEAKSAKWQNEPKPKNQMISMQALRAASLGKNGRSS